MSASNASRDDAEPPSARLTLHRSIESSGIRSEIPTEELLELWVWETIQSLPDFDKAVHYEVSLAVVDAPAIQTLNRDYRDKDAPTNVLSFPSGMPLMPATKDAPATRVLGDIVICQSVIANEAEAQDKSIQHHWTHMMVHSVLHLFGHDHIQPDEALAMEALEIKLLDRLSVSNPYQQPSQVS